MSLFLPNTAVSLNKAYCYTNLVHMKHDSKPQQDTLPQNLVHMKHDSEPQQDTLPQNLVHMKHDSEPQQDTHLYTNLVHTKHSGESQQETLPQNLVHMKHDSGPNKKLYHKIWFTWNTTVSLNRTHIYTQNLVLAKPGGVSQKRHTTIKKTPLFSRNKGACFRCLVYIVTLGGFKQILRDFFLLFLFDFLKYLSLDIFSKGYILVEFHRVVGTTTGDTSKSCGITKHFHQRNKAIQFL